MKLTESHAEDRDCACFGEGYDIGVIACSCAW